MHEDMSTRRIDGFLRLSFDAAAPLLLWLLYFFASYALVAAGCDARLGGMQWLGRPAIALALAIASGAMALLFLLMLGRAVMHWRAAPPTLLTTARLGIAALALLGFAWTAVPQWIMPLCAD